MDDNRFLHLALEQARKSVEAGGFPAGAVVVKDGKVVSRGISIGYNIHDPTSHAETAAVREACQTLGTSNLAGAVLYGSLQPCLMCFSVSNWAGISRAVFAARKTADMAGKGYYEGSTDLERINHENNRPIELVFVPELEQESLDIVKEWEQRLGIE